MPLEELTLRSRDGAYERSAWFRPGPTAPHRLGILLDGEFYLERAEVLPVIEKLTESERIPPMSWLFIASGGPKARHADYTYNSSYASYVAEDAVGWARERASALLAESHLVGGLSLSGLAAAHVALLHGDRFSAALCQSGSFWWKPEQLSALIEKRPPGETRFWLSVGDEETEVGVSHPPTGMLQSMSQIDGVERARQTLEQAGATLRVHQYSGGHDFAPWRAEMGEALTWLLGDHPATPQSEA